MLLSLQSFAIDLIVRDGGVGGAYVTITDAINYMAIEYKGKSIDKMNLSMLYTKGVCLDFSHKGLKELIEPNEIEIACEKANLKIEQGDTVLFYTDHYRKNFNGKDRGNGPGVSAQTTRWLGEKKYQYLELKRCRLEF